MPESPLVQGTLYMTLVEAVSIGQLCLLFLFSCLPSKQQRKVFFRLFDISD